MEQKFSRIFFWSHGALAPGVVTIGQPSAQDHSQYDQALWPAEVEVFRLAPYWHAKPTHVRPKSPSSRFQKPLDRLVSSKSDSPNSTSTPEARLRNAADAEPVDREQPASLPLQLADSLHDACHRGDV